MRNIAIQIHECEFQKEIKYKKNDKILSESRRISKKNFCTYFLQHNFVLFYFVIFKMLVSQIVLYQQINSLYTIDKDKLYSYFYIFKNEARFYILFSFD